ncbi:hypothetical protein E2C01_098917 [Portunus trituberculatus]|uniref:Uncharacterized protein n=1 Tax=Portunus trituberculatus TaxID=210409 RepID=A0A5B7KDC3_PORTR|nr:hypothetical protein [Portunus trituberculatus]
MQPSQVVLPPPLSLSSFWSPGG